MGFPEFLPQNTDVATTAVISQLHKGELAGIIGRHYVFYIAFLLPHCGRQSNREREHMQKYTVSIEYCVQ